MFQVSLFHFILGSRTVPLSWLPACGIWPVFKKAVKQVEIAGGGGGGLTVCHRTHLPHSPVRLQASQCASGIIRETLPQTSCPPDGDSLLTWRPPKHKPKVCLPSSTFSRTWLIPATVFVRLCGSSSPLKTKQTHFPCDRSLWWRAVKFKWEASLSRKINFDMYLARYRCQAAGLQPN